MPVIIGFDVGSKTIGIAYSDASEEFVVPGKTYWRQMGHRKDVAFIRTLVKERDAGMIVVGLPRNEDGSDSTQTELVRQFAAVLLKGVSVPVIFQDEYLSTFAAECQLEEAGVPRSKWKETVDSLAAAEIVREYLNSRKSAKTI